MKNLTTLSWDTHAESLNSKGYALIPSVLDKIECSAFAGLYDSHDLFRSTVNMQRYRFGKGEYKYFVYPLPPLVQSIRETLYPELATLANDWMTRLSLETRFPTAHAEMLEVCHGHHQLKPTPLILRYEAGGFNTLHQDLYGEVFFPFQLMIPLSQYGTDFEGGEFVLTENVPRAQSKVEVIRPNQGDAVIFTTNFRPVRGSKGYYRANVKHGVSEIRSGKRVALGIIFHDAA